MMILFPQYLIQQYLPGNTAPFAFKIVVSQDRSYLAPISIVLLRFICKPL